MAIVSIRNVPEETAKQLRIAAAKSGQTIRDYVLQLFEQNCSEQSEKPKRKKTA